MHVSKWVFLYGSKTFQTFYMNWDQIRCLINVLAKSMPPQCELMHGNTLIKMCKTSCFLLLPYSKKLNIYINKGKTSLTIMLKPQWLTRAVTDRRAELTFVFCILNLGEDKGTLIFLRVNVDQCNFCLMLLYWVSRISLSQKPIRIILFWSRGQSAESADLL